MAEDPGSLDSQLVELAIPLIARCAATWQEPGLAESLTLVVGRRLQRSLGRCYPERALVRIAPLVLELPSALREEIVCHEAAHLVVFSRHGRGRRPHGEEWKELMRALGFDPRARIQITPGDAISAAWAKGGKNLYEHRCPVCQAARLARRRMSLWRCRACVEVGLSGLLEISRRPGTELSL